MNNALQFKNFAVNNRKYYIADLELKKNAYNLSHRHDFYEFFVVMKGEFRENLNGHDITIGKGGIHVLRPDDTHYLTSTNQYNTNILRNIAVDKIYFEQCLKEVGVENHDSIFRCFELDEITFRHYQNKTKLLLQLSNGEETNHFLFKSILNDVFIDGLIQKNHDKNIPKWLQAAYEEVGKNKKYVEGLKTLIGLTGKSQEHFTREFKKYYGITPSEHINNLRLQEAASLLQKSDYKIIDIVYLCGFQNTSYFNRLFKEKYLLSPREYRDSNKNFFDISI